MEQRGLAEAEAQDKPIFLSIGYTGCHWCHVMNQESFTDPDIAALINENFIPVLVDREERPDIDQIYQAASNIMGHTGGWPLNMFLTPKGLPFFVGGYRAELPEEAGSAAASPPSAPASLTRRRSRPCRVPAT